jgi:brefeldin A-resistance guanine nucleotide exchange factor 1
VHTCVPGQSIPKLRTPQTYTTFQSFDFHDLKFDAAIRLYLESFRLPGEAQKINRIINAFGHHYFNHNKVGV